MSTEEGLIRASREQARELSAREQCDAHIYTGMKNSKPCAWVRTEKQGPPTDAEGAAVLQEIWSSGHPLAWPRREKKHDGPCWRQAHADCGC
jgi:hypothetical protein